MTAPAVRPYVIVGLFFGGLVGLILLLAVSVIAAAVVAVAVGALLTAAYLRGQGPWTGDIPESHPDALGSLDTERVRPTRTP